MRGEIPSNRNAHNLLSSFTQVQLKGLPRNASFNTASEVEPVSVNTYFLKVSYVKTAENKVVRSGGDGRGENSGTRWVA